MTLLSVVKLKLMLLASSRVDPYAPVLAIFSEPARSTRYSFPVLHEPSSLFAMMIVRTNKECDLELLSFIFVAATALLSLPNFMSA